jgi:hypothetical protein
MSIKAIARRLGISVHTAKFHVGALIDKFDAVGRTDAVAQAARRGVSTVRAPSPVWNRPATSGCSIFQQQRRSVEFCCPPLILVSGHAFSWPFRIPLFG